MKTLHVVIIALCIGGISSCISINTIPPEQKISRDELEKIRRMSGEKPVISEQDEAARTAPIKKPDIACPVFVLPEFGQKPGLPLKELAQVAHNDQKAIDRIEIQQIADLRDYITHMENTLHEEHSKYLTKCFTNQKQ